MLPFQSPRQTGGSDDHPRPLRRTTITYYCHQKKPLPGVLALVRFTGYLKDTPPVAVSEDIFYDDPDDFCRLEETVDGALHAGVDVLVMSHHPYDTFPTVQAYIDANK